MNRKTPELDEFIHNQSQKDSNQSPYAVDDLSEGCSAVDLSSSAEQQEQEQPALQGYELGKGHISEHNHIPISAQYKSSVIQKKESSQKYFMNQEDTFNPNKNGYGQPGVSSTLHNSHSLTWNKNKFKDMLQKQQDKIREISRSRQYSTRKPPKAKTNNSKIFNYSTVKSQITNNTVEKPKMPISMKNSRNHSTDESSLSMNYSRGRMSNTHIQKESSQSSVISCLTEQKNNTTIISSNTSTVQNYLDYRHMQTKDRIDKIKADRMKEQLSKCRSKPVINKKSIKIAKKLNKNTFERLYNAGKQKKQQQVAFNGTQVQMPYHRSHFGAQPTFSPSINKKSRSLSRTVKDLYIWNHQKNGHLKQKREQGSTHKIKICPGSAAIINSPSFSTINVHNRSKGYKRPNQDFISDKIILLTNKKNEKKALKVNKLKIKAAKPVKKKKNISSKTSLNTISEVSSNVSNQVVGEAALRSLSYRGSTSSENPSYTGHSRDSTRDKLDRFYMTSSPNCIAVSPEPSSYPHESYDSNQVVVSKMSGRTNYNHINSSLATSPFNSNRYETQEQLKSSSDEHSSNGHQVEDIANLSFSKDNHPEKSVTESNRYTQSQHEEEYYKYSNEDELYKLSNETSNNGNYACNTTEENREETPEPLANIDLNQRKDISKMQMHLREPSNESKHSYKLSEILFKSHQGTINDMGTEVYKSIRFSDDQMHINFMNGQMNIYSQINEKDRNQEQESSEDDNYNEPVYETTESYTTSNGRKTELNDDLCISNGESSPTKKYSTSGLNYDEYHKSAISHPNSQEDAKFSITQEQREGLMKRIMFLKMQKDQENQEFQEEEI